DKGNGGDDGSNPAHVHQWATTWSHDDTNHWHACTADGHTGAHKDVAPHVYDDAQDTTCNTCDYVRTISGGGNEGGGNEGENPNPPTTATFKEVAKVDISDLKTGSSSANAELVAGSGVSATGELVIKAGARNYTYNGTDAKSVNCIQVGKGSAKMLKVNLAEDSTVLVYAYSGSTGLERSLTLADSTGKELTEGAQKQSIGDDNGQFVVAAAFELKAGDNYIMSAADTINVIYIAVVQNLSAKEVKTEVAAVPNTCETAGNPKYYSTNFGRYFKADGTTVITKQADMVLAKLGHNWSVEGEVSVPSETNKGSVNIKCGNDATHTDVIVLPVLSSKLYNRSGESGTVTYTYNATVDGKTVPISFEAAYVPVAESNFIYDTFNVSTLTTESSTSNGKTVYTSDNLEVAFASTAPSGLTGAIGKKSQVAESGYTGLSATAPDGETQLSFTKGILPSGNGGVYTIKNKSLDQVTLTVYFTVCDSTFGNGNGANSIKNTIMYKVGTGAEVACDSDQSLVINAAVLSVTVSVASNETLTLWANAAGRCILYGVVGAYPKTQA
ncbi:MAG: hypothetical protein K2N33_00955, partial [Clostridia bacterium]|nr:hypothetical protein [Clostridia bacterium]